MMMMIMMMMMMKAFLSAAPSELLWQAESSPERAVLAGSKKLVEKYVMTLCA